MRLAVLPVALPIVAGCAESSPPQESKPPAAASAQTYSCLLPGEQRMLVAELFLGRSIPGRAPLTEAEWAEFAAQAITPNFPAGFTVMDGAGQWQNPSTGEISREQAKILLVAAPRSPDLAGRLSAVIEGYKARFHQKAVGIVTRDSCAAF